MWAFLMTMDKVGASGALVKMDGVKSGGSSIIPYFHCEEVTVEEGRWWTNPQTKNVDRSIWIYDFDS
jgi:hypothetical protein